MTERTPGTWVAKPHPFGSCWWVDTVHGSIQVSMNALHKGEKDEANARFIAAAPDMEKALETAAYVLEHYLDYTRERHSCYGRGRPCRPRQGQGGKLMPEPTEGPWEVYSRERHD